jgi:hypothetical protein
MPGIVAAMSSPVRRRGASLLLVASASSALACFELEEPGGRRYSTGSAGSAGIAASGAGTTGTAGDGAGTGGSDAAGGAGSSGAAGAEAAGSSGAAGSSAGSGSGSSGAAGDGGAGSGGAGAAGSSAGQSGSAGSAGSGGSLGVVDCKGRAVALSANGSGQASDRAMARVEIDLGTDLPIGNASRTVEFWMYVQTSDWVGDKNELYYYGASGTAAAFGLDFGTNGVAGQADNHATLNPFTGGGFDSDSTNDLGTGSSWDHWTHVAMTWNGTQLVTYVNGQPKITSTGSGATMLATGQSVFVLGCNPMTSQCFNGMFDELRIWNVARSAQEVAAGFDEPMTGSEPGLVGYYKFDEMTGTTTADSVTTAGHTPHPGTLKAATTADRPTFLSTQAPVPLVCP